MGLRVCGEVHPVFRPSLSFPSICTLLGFLVSHFHLYTALGSVRNLWIAQALSSPHWTCTYSRFGICLPNHSLRAVMPLAFPNFPPPRIPLLPMVLLDVVMAFHSTSCEPFWPWWQSCQDSQPAPPRKSLHAHLRREWSSPRTPKAPLFLSEAQ